MRRTACLGMLAYVFLICAKPLSGQSQATSGTVQGFIRDESGAVLPDASVVVRHLETGLTRELTTDVSGYYHSVSLPSGTYDVQASRDGFATVRRTGIALSLGQSLDVDIVLKVSPIAEQVTVEASGPVLEVAKTEVSTTVGERAIQELPISGRRFTDFVLLTPGVTQDPRGLSGSQTGDLSFGGLRGINNNVQIDGVDNNNAFFAQSRGRYRAPYNFSQAAVKEFQVVNSNFSAEFGKAAGAVVNVITKSGTNELHGEAFYFIRDSGVAARNPFLDRKFKSRQQQFGGSIGLPIARDQLFFFGSYDQQVFRVPTNVRLLGIPAADAANPDPAIQGAIRFLRGLEGDFKAELLANVFLAKADWILSPQQRLSARYNYQHLGGSNNVFFNLVNPVTRFSIDNNATGTVRTDSAVLSLTSVLSARALNEFRFQFAWDDQNNVSNSDVPQASITNVISGFGRATTEPRYTRERRFQFMDTYSLTRGRHELKAGADMSVLRIGNFFPGTFGGSYSFASISDFVLRSPTSYEQNFGNPVTNPDTMQYAFFVQENWRTRPDLNLNFGLRYELETYRTNQLEANPAYPSTGRIRIDKNNLAPRFGFSWAPSMAKSTVVRGGYGFFYGRTAQIITSTAISGNGLRTQRFTLSRSVPAQAALIPPYPNRLSAPPNLAAVRSDVFVFAPDFVNPYAQQGSFGIERQLRDAARASVTYVVVKGTHLNRSRDVNLFAPTPVVLPIFDGATQVGTGVVRQFNTTTRPVAALGQINTFESVANSIYHGLIVSLNRRWSDNYQFQLSYTLSKAIDDGPDALIVTRAGRVQNTFNAGDERALSVTDQRHRFVFSWTWAPEFKALQGAASPLLNGWKLGAISTVTSGRPVNGQASGDPNRDGNSNNDRTAGLGRNSFRGFGYHNHDLRVTRVFNLNERSRIEFLTEFFNIFNHTNLLFGRNDDGFFRTHSAFRTTPAPARLDLTPNFLVGNEAYNPRQIQFALKFIF
ncbi:MAG: TonB-dependent receptor [Acidobacteria bacterium]|nr:TonB-dependent receptor [Acidobacteriota bacterium]